MNTWQHLHLQLRKKLLPSQSDFVMCLCLLSADWLGSIESFVTIHGNELQSKNSFFSSDIVHEENSHA